MHPHAIIFYISIIKRYFDTLFPNKMIVMQMWIQDNLLAKNNWGDT